MHDLIVPIELKQILCHNKRQSFVSLPGRHNHTPHSWQYHFQGGTAIRHTHGSTISRVAQPYATLMAVPLPGWHNHTPHSWQYHFQGGTTIRHTHGSTTSRVAQPYATLMAVPLPGRHNHTPHSWQYHFQGGTTIRHTHGSTTSREAQPYATLMAGPLAVASFLLLIAVSAATSIALSWRCCGDLHW